MKPSRLRALMAILAVVASAALATPAQAAPANPYQRGPDPTPTSITAETGPFAISSVTVPAGSGQGFNDGTVYYPTDTSEGTFGAVVIMPASSPRSRTSPGTGPGWPPRASW
ncbi:hypothetical protein RKE30_26575 [Streptomyces sp. Li-HN-5-11]|nr:hypothetical protein [Streptomyces sp. Li-HN-5-11]WNM33697.1 hypothetical protein RKE30_26575 [Streptomyces sp. Li-HN-5-11]